MKKSSAAASVIAGLIAAMLLSFLVSLDIALFVGFILAIALLIYSDRKSVRLEGIVIIRRTQKGKNFINKVARAAPNGWRRLSVVGIVLAVILMASGSLLLLTQASAVISGAQGGVKLLLPGPVSSPVNAPGVFVVPWWIWIIGIAVVIIPHEFMHGVMCRIDGIRIRSVGWLLLILVPGAFVEPDEKQLAKAKRMTKLRVYAAGSFANMIVAAIVIILFAAIFAPAVAPAGVFVLAQKDGPAYNASLNGSITAINGFAVKTPVDISRELSKYKPGDIVTVTTAETNYMVPAFLPGNVLPGSAAVTNSNMKNYSVTLGQKAGSAFLGVAAVAPAVMLKMDIHTYATFSTLLLWMFLFSFGIGLVNLLPIKPLDGGLIFEELVKGRYQKIIVRAVSVFMLLVLIFNIVGPLFLAAGGA